MDSISICFDTTLPMPMSSLSSHTVCLRLSRCAALRSAQRQHSALNLAPLNLLPVRRRRRRRLLLGRRNSRASELASKPARNQTSARKSHLPISFACFRQSYSGEPLCCCLRARTWTQTQARMRTRTRTRTRCAELSGGGGAGALIATPLRALHTCNAAAAAAEQRRQVAR